MDVILSLPSRVIDFVMTLWTPLFVVLFFAAIIYAIWPRNKASFDAAAKMPLRED